MLAKIKNYRLYIGILSVFFITIAQSQTFSPNTYYENCLRFEALGNLEIAEENCLNALEIQSDFPESNLALARIYFEMGDASQSERRLALVPDTMISPEISILGAEIALARGNLSKAEQSLNQAKILLAEKYDNEQKSQLYSLSAKISEAKGEYKTALEDYGNAILNSPLNKDYRLGMAKLQFKLGLLDDAKQQLETYQEYNNDYRDPDILALIGRIKWAQGNLKEASTYLEKAVTMRGSSDTKLQSEDLATLAYIYYGQGNTRAGNLTLKDASRYNSPFLKLVVNKLIWLALLILTLGIHLWGESKIVSKTSLEYVEKPEPWTMQNFYSILFSSIVIAFIAMMAFSFFRYHNLLAILTPIQLVDTRAVFFIIFSLVTLALMIKRLQKNSWDISDVLIQSADKAPQGIIWGIVLLIITLAYLIYSPQYLGTENFYLNLTHLTPLLIAAAILLPINELFFRTFAITALKKRYGTKTAIIIASLVFALFLGNPLALVVLIGLILSIAYNKTNVGLIPTIALLTLHLGLILAVAFVPRLSHLFY